MFRHRARPPLPPLDEATVDRLLDGAPIAELPEAYQPLGQLLADARSPALEQELDGSAAAAATFVAVRAAETPRRRVWSMGALALLALTVAASTGTAVAASRGALPQPVQAVAHDTLGAVGISVPGSDVQEDDDDRKPADDTNVKAASRDAITATIRTVQSGTRGEAPGTTSSGDDPTGRDAPVPQGGAGANPDQGTPAGPDPGTPAGPDPDTPAAPDPGTPADPGQGAPEPGPSNPSDPDHGKPADPGPGNPNPGQGNPADPGERNPNPSGRQTGEGEGPPLTPPGQAKK
jgi:hypothetical protein